MAGGGQAAVCPWHARGEELWRCSPAMRALEVPPQDIDRASAPTQPHPPRRSPSAVQPGNLSEPPPVPKQTRRRVCGTPRVAAHEEHNSHGSERRRELSTPCAQAVLPRAGLLQHGLGARGRHAPYVTRWHGRCAARAPAQTAACASVCYATGGGWLRLGAWAADGLSRGGQERAGALAGSHPEGRLGLPSPERRPGRVAARAASQSRALPKPYP